MKLLWCSFISSACLFVKHNFVNLLFKYFKCFIKQNSYFGKIACRLGAKALSKTTVRLTTLSAMKQ
jgi:hypothetical protein